METVRMRQHRRRSSGGLKGLMLICVLIGIAIGGWFGWMRFVPNNEEVKPDYGQANPILYMGKVMDEGAVIDGEAVKLPLDVIRDELGLQQEIYDEPKTGTIVLTNASSVLRLKTNALTATINSKPYDLRVAAEVKDKIAYIPSDPLKELYGVQVEYDKATGIVTVLRAGDAVQRAVADKNMVIRTEPTIKAPIVQRVSAAGDVRVWGEEKGWYLVQYANGVAGYAAKKDLTLSQVERIDKPVEKPAFTAWKAVGSKINLTWEAVYTKTPDPSTIGDLAGVNVLSPSWFELLDGSGAIGSKADMNYVNWAHGQGRQIWAMFSNGFEPERTTQALATADTRFKMIQQLVAFAQMYKLQGINLDFENVRTSDKANLIQFVRELTPLLHEQQVSVSIDVTPKSSSELWSLFLDRAALGDIVDYMMLMAYDEHWASSPTSGSVASLPWVEQSLKRILEEDLVPPSKVVLGMPLYARVWTEKKDKTGAVKVTSAALGMEDIQDIIAKRKLKPVLDAKSGQHYVEYEEDGTLKRIWIEDAYSIKARVALAKKYELAGVATWQRAFQSDDIWEAIDQSLTKLP